MLIPINMTTDEFNEKYKDYLEPGHYGLAINHPAVIEYLDTIFKGLILIDTFAYSQIKMKFGAARVYMEPLLVNTHKIEQEIDRIIKG